MIDFKQYFLEAKQKESPLKLRLDDNQNMVAEIKNLPHVKDRGWQVIWLSYVYIAFPLGNPLDSQYRIDKSILVIHPTENDLYAVAISEIHWISRSLFKNQSIVISDSEKDLTKEQAFELVDSLAAKPDQAAPFDTKLQDMYDEKVLEFAEEKGMSAFDKVAFLSVKGQEEAIKKFGKQVLLHMHLAPEIKEKYSGIANLKRSGLFR